MKKLVKRHPILFTLFVLVVALIAVATVGKRPKPMAVKTSKVERAENLTSTVSAPGTIRANELVDIQAEVAGVIVDLPVKEGEKVSKGQVLLRIDPLQAETDLAGARARHAAAEADVARQAQTLKSSVAEHEQAQITARREARALARQRDLLKTGTISADQFEDSEAQAKISVGREAAAKARVDQCKAEARSVEQNLAAAAAALRRAEDQLSKVTIVSPLAGTIVSLNVDVGERAVPGIQSNPQATLMTIANLLEIEAEVRVSETDITRVARGNPAKVEVDALEDKKIEGTVSEIGSAPMQTSSGSSGEGKDFKVVVAIDKAPPELRIGMSCEADITVATRSDVLTIPIQALTMREVDVDTSGTYIAPTREEKEREAKGKGKSSKSKKPAKSGKSAKSDLSDKSTPSTTSTRSTPSTTSTLSTQSTTSTASTKDKKDQNDKKEAKKDKKELEGVFVMADDGFAHFRPVKCGIMGETNVEVLDGLKEGEETITGPLKSLRNLDEWSRVRKETGKGKDEKE